MSPIQTIPSPNYRLCSFDEAHELANSIRTQEVYCEPRNMHFLLSGCLEANGRRWPIADVGLSSLCKTLRIPFQYAVRIPLELLCENVNKLLSETHSEFHVRAQHWQQMPAMAVTNFTLASAFFLPHRILLECMVAAQKKMEFKVERIGMSPGVLRAEVTFGNEVCVFPNDLFRMGCAITAGENSRSQSVTIQAYVYRLICQNGLVASKTFEQISFRPLRRQKMSTIVSLIEHGLSRVYGRAKEIQGRLRATAESKMKQPDALWLFRRLGRRVPPEALSSFQPERLSQKTYFEVLNAITSRANETENIERQGYFQLLGGEVMEMALRTN